MESPLSFNSSENFRKKLLLRNLPPYKVENSFSTGDEPAKREIQLLDYAIIDSPKIETIGDRQEKNLYVKNQYGPEKKNSNYGDTVNININQNTKTNEGEYGFSDTLGSRLEKIGDGQENLLYVKNLYGPVGLGTNYGETIKINDTSINTTNLGNYGYPLTVGSKLETIGDNQENVHIVKNIYKPIGLDSFGDTVWFINDDEVIQTTGSGEYTISDTLNSYLFQIGNTQEVFHKVKNLYKPTTPNDYGNTVWNINDDNAIVSMGAGTYTIQDTLNSYLFQIGNTQEIFLKTKNAYKPATPQGYGNTVWGINDNDQLITNGSGEYSISDTLNSYLFQIGNTQEIFHKGINVYKPNSSQDYGNTVWGINDNEQLITNGSGEYSISDTLNSFLYQIGNSQETILIAINKYSPENSIQYGETKWNINNNLTLGSNEGEYGYPDTIDNILYYDGKNSRLKLSTLNQYGPDKPNYGDVYYDQNLQTQSNEGEYGFPDTINSPLENISEQKENDAYIINKYVTGSGSYGNPELVTIDDLQIPNTGLPYANSDSTYIFLPSTYSPVSILVSDNPNGSDGTLSQDSALANLAAKQLQKEFKHRVALELLQQTLGRVNLFDSQVNPDTGEISAEPNLDPFNAIGLLSGQIPIISRDYTITNPDLFLGQAINFAARLAGTYSPYSFIPGEYFDYPEKKGSSFYTNPLSIIGGAIGGVFRLLQPRNQSASELFVEYTSVATRNLLYDQLRLNVFRPDYKIGNNLLAPKGRYYVGKRKRSINEIVSPDGELPESKIKGVASEIAVYSYGKIGEEYEGTKISEIYTGLNSRAYIDGSSGVQGGFTWLSKAGRGNKNYILPGDFVGVGGETFKDKSEFKFSDLSSTYETTKSTNYDFTEGSLLDVTQKIVDAGNRSKNKLQHVGNAINQVSKVFNDGYIELTKGSRVIRYTTPNSIPASVSGQRPIAGYEYCRLFTKDRPYMSYDELQKTDGNIRKFDMSVLDNTYNLNIAPFKGNESTNIQAGKVKKYMFSLENLSWRTSNRPGYTYEDLPDCEKGPNGGRIMWFPPYDLSFDESITTNWKDNTFLGRPEPIYTYGSTSRKGNISWKIVVDHPSIMNVILNEELERAKTSDTEITKVLNSFFAGCLKYDLYDLVKKFSMFTPNDVYQVLEEITYPEDIVTIVETLPNENVENLVEQNVVPNSTPTPTPTPTPIPNQEVEVNKPDVLQFTESIFFFHNDFPRKKSTSEPTKSDKPYDQTLTAYKALKNDYLNTGGNDGVRSFGKAKDIIIKYDDPTYTNYTSYILGAPKEIQEKYLDSYIETRKDSINEFFGYIDSEFEEIKKFLTQVCIAIKQGGKVSFTLKSSASAVTNVAYNVDLSKRRIDSALQYILSFEYDGVKLKNEYNNTLIITTVAEGETANILDPKYKYITCGKDFESDSNEGVVSVNAMACRRVRIIDVKHDEPVNTNPPPVTNQTNVDPPEEASFAPPTNNDTTTNSNANTDKDNAGYTEIRQKQDPIVKRTTQVRQDITKRLARKMLTECNYFELLKQKDPIVYDGLKSKLKHFNPVFHSITPEGLNARLTFLQQCMRPGDTIPTVSKDGNNTTLIYNDVTNSVFGAPPVCVLRIGDFFHTKIVIDSLSIKYEDGRFDLNPEGIGVQPMIADVSISFNFIGGHGLAEPVAKLQNALSFNYYANTEMYDERADATEDNKTLAKYDAEILADIKNQATIQDNVNKPLTSEAGDTIGLVKTTNVDLTTQASYGEISYEDIMKKISDQTKAYADTTITNLEKMNDSFLIGSLIIATKDRKFTDGYFDYLTGNTSYDTHIYGISDTIQNKIQELVKDTKDDVENNLCPLLPLVGEQNFNNSDIRKIKRRIKDLIEEKGNQMIALLEQCNGTIANEELKLIKLIDKLNYVAGTNDGFVSKNGNAIVYELTGGTGVNPSSVGVTDTFQEFLQDFLIIRSDLNEFNNELYKNKIIPSGNTEEYNDTFVFNTFISDDFANTTPAENRFFMLFGKDIITNAEEFSNTVIDVALKNEDTMVKDNWKAYFGVTFYTTNTGLVDSYTKSKTIVDNRFKSFNDNFYKNKYNTYNPYNKDKTRIMSYGQILSPTSDQQNNLKDIYNDRNSLWDKFNLKKSFN